MKNVSIGRFLFCGALALLVPFRSTFAADADTNAPAAAPAKPAATTNSLTHTLSATNAADAWAELTVAPKEPSPPDEWLLKAPTDQQKFQFLLPFALSLADKSKDFYTRFPNDTNAFTAREREFGILTWAVTRGATNEQARLDAAETAMLAQPSLSEDDRFDIRESAIQRAVHRKAEDGDTAMLSEFEKGARALQKDFPKRPEVMAMLLQVAASSEADKARAILKEVATNDLPDELKNAVADLTKDLDRIGKPLDLQFKALDGRDVDVAKMQGKVVLVDFWATTSEESLALLDDVKGAYATNHAKGLEIVGINMDEDKETLTNIVAEEKLDWPEYYDGKKAETKFAVQFGVKELPEMWLLDKKGLVRYVNAGFNLEKKIEILLGE